MSELTVLLIWLVPYVVAFYTLRLIRRRDNDDPDGPPPPPDWSAPPPQPHAPGPRRRPQRPASRPGRGPVAHARPRPLPAAAPRRAS